MKEQKLWGIYKRFAWLENRGFSKRCMEKAPCLLPQGK
jgi:hypothetical protein